MPLTDRQKLTIAGAAAALLAALATFFLIRHFSPPSRPVKIISAPELVPTVHALVDELRQLPTDARALRLGPPPEAPDIKPDAPALQIAFDALAEAEDVEVLHVDTVGNDETLEALILYEDVDGKRVQIALLCRRVGERIVPITLLR